MDLTKVNKAHFVGVGGIGVSAVARMMLARGSKVTGSDEAESPITESLACLGAKIFIGHRAENLSKDVDLVIYTIAIPPDNPEFLEARRRKLPVLSYPEALGEISQDKFTIAVSGTHGKTTTTAMLAKIMIEAGLDPTVIVGSLITTEFGEKTNFLAGRSKYFLVEACEYRRSFLHLRPSVLVITNIDNDHLDYYRNLADIQSAFRELENKLLPEGKLITQTDYQKTDVAGLKLLVPGEYNLENARAALATAGALGIDRAAAVKALNSFQGTWRRLEYHGETSAGAKLYDDYGHHPTEIKATLATLRQLVSGKIFVVFQPHLYSRTKILFEDFAKSFHEADEVILVPVYAAREPVDSSVDLNKLAETIRVQSGCEAQFVSEWLEVATAFKARAGKGDVILTLGAGDVYRFADILLK